MTVKSPTKKKVVAKPRLKTRPKKEDPSKQVAQCAAQAAYDTKAVNLIVLDLEGQSGFSDYFVIATGTSDRHVQSIADRVEEALSQNKIKPLGIEGRSLGQWILMDYGSVVIHIFQEEAREFYSLEKFWEQAKPVKFRYK